MDQLINVVTSWPAIVQGALGSALFALFLYIGQIISLTISSGIGKFNKQKKKMLLTKDLSRARALTSQDFSTTNTLMLALIYTALEDIVKALIMFSLGAIISSFVPIFGVVGFLVAFYFLFKALDSVRSWDSTKDPEKEEKRIQELLDEMNT